MARSSLILKIFVALFLVSSCANPASDKPAAVTNEAAPVTASSPAVQGERYVITPDSSEVKFVGSRLPAATMDRSKSLRGPSTSLANQRRAASALASTLIHWKPIRPILPSTSRLPIFLTWQSFRRPPLFRRRSNQAGRKAQVIPLPAI
jgi:hypothetical protein